MTMTFTQSMSRVKIHKFTYVYSAGLDILSLGCHAGVHIYFCLMFDCVLMYSDGRCGVLVVLVQAINNGSMA